MLLPRRRIGDGVTNGAATTMREMQKQRSEAVMEKEERMKERRVAKVQRMSNAMKASLSFI